MIKGELMIFVFVCLFAIGFVGATDFAGLDVNQDGKINVADVGIVGRSIGQTGCADANNWCNKTDINQDGIVDSADITLLQEHYGNTGVVATGDNSDGSNDSNNLIAPHNDGSDKNTGGNSMFYAYALVIVLIVAVSYFIFRNKIKSQMKVENKSKN